MEHTGKVAIVTGGASGMGRATALGLAREGAAVVVADWNDEGAGRVQREIEAAGGRGLAVPTDVAGAASVRAMAKAAVASFGRIDFLVCAAAIPHSGQLADTEEAEWDRVLAIDLKGVFLCCQSVVPQMIAAGGGRIVTIASGAGVRPYAYGHPYSAAKAGVIALSKGLAMELAPRNILVNVVVPGMTDTPMARASMAAIGLARSQAGQDWDALARASNPLGRAGQPEDVADVIILLTKHATRHITGQTVYANGGAIMP
jgi:NAD(P)-dependent dehydrogenase (short-subunit alcohol dehydrogenase family)